MKLNYFLVFFVALNIFGCGAENDTELGGFDCVTATYPGIAVYVFDQETGSPISCGATVVIGNGSYTETVTEVNLYDGFEGNCINFGALEGMVGKGSYTVIVSKVGYQDYVATDVEVVEGSCGVITTDVEVYLSK